MRHSTLCADLMCIWPINRCWRCLDSPQYDDKLDKAERKKTMRKWIDYCSSTTAHIWPAMNILCVLQYACEYQADKTRHAHAQTYATTTTMSGRYSTQFLFNFFPLSLKCALIPFFIFCCVFCCATLLCFLRFYF